MRGNLVANSRFITFAVSVQTRLKVVKRSMWQIYFSPRHMSRLNLLLSTPPSYLRRILESITIILFILNMIFNRLTKLITANTSEKAYERNWTSSILWLRFKNQYIFFLCLLTRETRTSLHQYRGYYNCWNSLNALVFRLNLQYIVIYMFE
jgi:hypothetical protein